MSAVGKTWFAPAKVNLGLSVLGKRPDGYHALSSVMVALSVGDKLEVAAADTLTLAVRGARLPTDQGNLVYRAAQAYLQAAKVRGGARLTLHKSLPLASGLGGGSSDAASTLLALAQLYPSGVELAALACRLGADVPFFLRGGAALAEGIGERLTSIALPLTHLVLLNPGVAISARDAYGWLAETGRYTPPVNVPEVLSALSSGAQVPYFNALQAGVLGRFPQVQAALSALTSAGLSSPLMSGSGSTVFGLASSAAQAAAAAEQLRHRFPGYWVQAAHTVGSGP